ncbi:MAG: D-tyrosyl-tRNA(Tyr) deacylase [Bacteroidetes bacterium]|nr:D-tyrosyl-tRNA(Tyr) deacylase [Bacteroidota bacterium]
MKIVIQRVNNATVTVDEDLKGAIAHGLLVFVGIVNDDTIEDVNWISYKLVNLRIFDDEHGVPNLTVGAVKGGILLVSQFTLHARTRKGARPSYVDAAAPEVAIPLYEGLIKRLRGDFGKEIQTGEFGAVMDVALVNSGPYTIIIDTKDKGKK